MYWWCPNNNEQDFGLEGFYIIYIGVIYKLSGLIGLLAFTIGIVIVKQRRRVSLIIQSEIIICVSVG